MNPFLHSALKTVEDSGLDRETRRHRTSLRPGVPAVSEGYLNASSRAVSRRGKAPPKGAVPGFSHKQPFDALTCPPPKGFSVRSS